MIPLKVRAPRGRPLRLLFVGAHADDIEIGCGGTALRLLRRRPAPEAHWVVAGARGDRAQEAEASARAFLRGARAQRIEVKGFRDGYFPSQLAEIKDFFEALKRRVDPDLVFTHARGDLHQDHRVVSDLTWNTFRAHTILEYEIPKYDGDLGAPNVFVPIDEATCRKKIALLLRHFRSQRGKHWFDEEVFRAVMRLRGVETGGAARLAEAFYARKLVLEPHRS
jgi:LmbE family N-acetylglucosaminyl deacetylase